MSRSISPLSIRIQASGSRQVQGEIRQTAGSFDVVVQKAAQAGKAMERSATSAKEIVIAGRGVERMGEGFDKAGNAAGAATKKVAGMNTELQGAEKNTKSLGDRMFEADKRAVAFIGHAKELGQHIKTASGHAMTLWNIWGAFKKGGPFKLFDAVVPQAVKTKLGLGMLAGGVGLSALLGSTIKPAEEKETRVAAITGLTGSKDVANDIYNTTDKASTSSVFNLPELVVAAKTLTKDRQFSTRLLKAADDLAAANKDEGVNPQDVARMLGRLRAGDTGEALQRARDFGIGRPDMEAKGLKFDASGALEDKSAAGISKAVDTMASIIEERFGGLSERLATTTLEGSLSNMDDAIGRFKTSIGESFIPVLNYGAQTIQTFVTWLNGMPEGMKTALAWGTAFLAGFLLVGGAFLIVGGTISKVVFAYKALNFILGICGTSVGKLALQLLTRLLPSLGMIALGIALVAVAAWGIKTAIQGTADAAKQSNAELEYHWGIMGSIWVKIADFMNAVWNHPLLAWLHGGSSKQAGDSAAEESLAIVNASRKKRGLKPITTAEQDTVGGKEETVDDVRKREEGKSKNAGGGAALKGWQAQQAAMWAKMGIKPDAGAGVMPSMDGGGAMGFGPAESKLRGEESADVQAAQSRVDNLSLEVQALQDQKRGTTDKDLKKAIGDKIIAKGRLLQAARRELAAVKKLAARQERDAGRAEKAEAPSEDKVQDNEFEIKKATIEDKYKGGADKFERDLKAAKTAGDGAKIRRLTQQLGNLKAQEQLELDLMSADREKDAAIRTSLRKKAQNAYRLARNAAARDANNAALDAEEERQNTVRKGNVDARKAETSNSTDAQVAPLEEALDAAKEAADFSRIRSLTLQIESLKAEQEYADAMADATLEDNAEKRKQMERLALIRKTGALAKAVYAADKAVRGAKKDGDTNNDKGAREALARMRAATPGGTSFLGRPLQPGGTMDDGVPSLAGFGRDTTDLNRERTARVAAISQNANGNWKVKFDEIELPYQGIGDAEIN